ncbi:pentatricopeptide repeat-containing protein At2g30780 [Punica granatum]|nr:pentatricopeptide repeat-containing protein At2g30780 [Punica granatum]OWM87176.1 hypothetical protein CDL15_Pgr010208 [Punica granatum]
MKRLWRISDVARPCRVHRNDPIPLLPHIFTLTGPTNHTFNPDPSPSPSSSTPTSSSPPPPSPTTLQSFIGLFIDKFAKVQTDYWAIHDKVSDLRDCLVQAIGDPEQISGVLEKKGKALLRRSPDGDAFIELLTQLHPWPRLALEVFTWRRELAESGIALTSEEYAKGIKVAGRAKDVSLAVELFNEAAAKRLKTTATYNALMTGYMSNGLPSDCQKTFRDLKRDPSCTPTIVTYNILISVFGRMMLVGHMETTFQEIEILNLSPNLGTYNNLIAGYLTAWIWDSMERTFLKMKASSVKPDIETYSLLLRGYAHCGNLKKMEEMYELVRHHDTEKIVPLIRAMICAYCKSSSSDRIRKIQALVGLIPDNQYRPWLNVLLIRLYAQEDWLEEMENYINEAFEHNTAVHAAGIMRSIIASYFRCNAVDRLARFVRRAESAEWRICRSLYHCLMVMYALENRLEEMESVLDDMEKFHLNCTKKTFFILYNAYSTRGQKHKVKRLLGLMCKRGYGFPVGAVAS